MNVSIPYNSVGTYLDLTCTALRWTCINGHKKIVELLLSHNNIDINIQDKVSKNQVYYSY